jgi:hypothetical protein
LPHYSGLFFGRAVLFKTAIAVAALAALIGTPAFAADMAVKVPPPTAGCVQAVDGVNGKLGGFGGETGGKTYAAGEGALDLPLGCALGAQIDAIAGSFDGRFIGTVAGHLFWRNPAQGLLGAYGDFTGWDQFGGVHAAHAAPEGEAYFGQWTLQGVAGVEFGNSQSGIFGSILQTYDIRTRFFDQANIAFYPTDNFEVYVGHRYLGGLNAAAFGGEWGIPLGNGMMAGLFAEGHVGEHSDNGVWGGLRFYFGQKDKTLIRRHREDDPPIWNNGSDTINNNGSQSPTPSTGCQPPNIILDGVCGRFAG